MVIDENIVKEMYNFFEDYIRRFDFNGEDSKIMRLLKYEHTMRVAKLCKELSKTIFDKKEDEYLSEIIGLFHDIGRWKQYYKYKTLKDDDSEDHAKLSVEVLKENNVLYKLNKTQQKFVLDSIYEHNKKYTNIKDDRCLIFAKIVRDADRIDNYKVECEIFDAVDKNRKVLHIFPETKGLSKEVYETIKEKKLVDNKDRKNINDFKFAKLAWIFDMSFKRSFEIIKENGYIDKIFNNIKEPTKEMEELYGIIKEFVDEKLKYQ